MEKKFKWPGGAKGAVSLTYDDGLITQLENAMPQLDRAGIKATFFPSGESLREKSYAPAWKRAVKAGHELGCHTMNHPCDKKHEFVIPGYSLQEYSAQRMKDEIIENMKVLKGFGCAKTESFAYPCAETSLGNNMSESYIPLIRGMFTAARGIKDEIADPYTVELYDTPSIGVTCGGKEMIDLVKQAESSGGWMIFLFHGVGGDYISVTTDAHAQLVEYLSGNRNSVYTDTFGKIAGHIKKKR